MMNLAAQPPVAQSSITHGVKAHGALAAPAELRSPADPLNESEWAEKGSG